MKDIIAAIQYLHSLNPPVIHRDIKPENLILDLKG
jgi:serine/threonine protein kinase